MSIPYRQRVGIAQSDLKLFAASPLLYYQVKIEESVPAKATTDEMRFGQQCEAFIRSRGEPTGAKIIPDEALMNGARRGKPWATFKEETPDHEEWVTRREWEASTESLRAILKSVDNSELASELLLGPGEWSVQLEWQCPASGLPRKAELDRLINCNPGVHTIVDLKTCGDSSPRAFCKQSHELGYVVQAATYVEAVEESLLRPNGQLHEIEVEFLFVAVRSKPPYDVWVYSVPDELIEAGRAWNHEHMAELSRRYDSNDWEPAIQHAGSLYRPSEVGEIVLPRYASGVYETAVEILE